MAIKTFPYSGKTTYFELNIINHTNITSIETKLYTE